MSNQGRPDRLRSKLSSDEALNQLHNVDDIFPHYEDHFNVTRVENSSTVIEILSERIHNIEGKLTSLKENLGNGAFRVFQTTANIFAIEMLSILVLFFA